MRVSEHVTALPGVGQKRAETLLKLGIETVGDLLRHYPFRYEDRRKPLPVALLTHGEAALVRVSVRRVIRAQAAMRGALASRIPMKVICGDESGEMTLLYFNAHWMSGVFQEGAEYWVYGIPRADLAGVFMAHPEIEAVKDGEEDGSPGAGIVPVYPLTSGVSQKYLRRLVRAALPYAAAMEEIIPEEIAAGRRLAPLSFALTGIHFPEDEHALSAARYRLIYEEFFIFQARLFYARNARQNETEGDEQDNGDGNKKEGDVPSVLKVGLRRTEGTSPFVSNLSFPFELTGAQKKAIEEIRGDMAGAAQMHRLLQGDVGSGKTAVAADAAFFTAMYGSQAAVMAPTEILAAQHYKEFSRLFEDTGIRVCLLTSGISPAQRREAIDGLKSGEIKVAIGTHALIEPDVVFDDLRLVVTDEQHRFGVRQRLKLREKGRAPDTLVMTATPIPRTLALMMYADLDLSVLDEMPPGRKPVTTRYIDSSKRDDAYDFAERVMAGGGQVYVVAPSIGDDETKGDVPSALLSPTFRTEGTSPFVSMASAVELAEEMKERFAHRRVSVLHGRMRSADKEEVMRAFAAGEIDMLVSTVVIEVGVNVPNATMMIVENAERFGLAALHQLRGRVGRGAAKSYCVLISDADTEVAVKRLEAIAGETDGFKIAELDMELRGSGDLFGIRQHGLMGFKLADPAKHLDILGIANVDAQALIARDPDLNFSGHAPLRAVINEGGGG